MFETFPLETLYAYPVPEVNGSEFATRALVSHLPFPDHGGATAVYIHVPFCVSICEFCGFIRSADMRNGAVGDFCNDLVREIEVVSRTLALPGQRVQAVFFGGGTASVLNVDQIDSILSALHRVFSISPDADKTFEGECLTLLKSELLEEVASRGFQRLSFGVQIMDPGARRVLNLKPTHAQLRRLAEKAGGLFRDVCVDYIFGWPLQTEGALRRDLRCLFEIVNPISIELFQFEKLDASPAFLQSLYKAGCRDLTTPELQELHGAAVEECLSAGYQRQGYTMFTKSSYSPSVSYGSCYYGWGNGNVLGFGRGAQSFFNGVMWGNGLTAKAYSALIRAGLLPVADFARYERDERELVTWPRRGWIQRPLRWSRWESQIGLLESAGLAEARQNIVYLTALGESWVPSILEFLMPASQRQRANTIALSRLKGRASSPLPVLG